MEPTKRSLGAGEPDEFLRVAWRALVAEGIDAKRLVFVDEIGANVSLSVLYAWSCKGERASGSAPREARLYTLRHTFATLWMESNEPVKILQEILGHSRIDQTMNTYAHVSHTSRLTLSGVSKRFS